MKVTIITVVRNAVGKIEQTIQSVLAQNYNDLEYIIIDGQSSDGTLGVIDRYRSCIDVVVSEPDDGLYDALNKGVKITTGEWIGIMNAGDVFVDNDVIRRIFDEPELISEVDVIYGDAISVDGGFEQYVSSKSDISEMNYGPAYRHGASFVRSVIHKSNLFDLGKKGLLSFALDYEQMYRMYKKGLRFRRVPFPIMKYELRGLSTTSPFKVTYYNYLIPHDMKCNPVIKLFLFWLTLWRGAKAIILRFYVRRRM